MRRSLPCHEQRARSLGRALLVDLPCEHKNGCWSDKIARLGVRVEGARSWHSQKEALRSRPRCGYENRSCDEWVSRGSGWHKGGDARRIDKPWIVDSRPDTHEVTVKSLFADKIHIFCEHTDRAL